MCRPSNVFTSMRSYNHFQRVTPRLCLAVMSAVMGSFAFGYNTGVINAPEEVHCFSYNC